MPEISSSFLSSFMSFGLIGKIGQSKTVWECLRFPHSVWSSIGCTKSPDRDYSKQSDLILPTRLSTTDHKPYSEKLRL